MSTLVAALALASCGSVPFVGEYSPQAGKRQAQRDFAAGHPQIYRAGGYATYEPAVTGDAIVLVAGLPRNGSLSGCTNPKVSYSDAFAGGYNREMILLLREAKTSVPRETR